MKIRIKGNSVRFRLSKSEIDQMAQEGFVESSTAFPDSVFKYSLVSRHDITQLQASFNSAGIQLQVPQHWADEWVATQRVGFDSEVDLGNGQSLSLLLEKDFQCLDDRGEDESDLYPNPLAKQS